MFKQPRRHPIGQIFVIAMLVGVFTLGGASTNNEALAKIDSSAPSAPTLVVTGAGTVSISPDQAKVTLAVVNNDKLLATAQEENTTTTRKVIEALTTAGIAKKNIETANFSVWPQYSYPSDKERDKPPAIIGYQVRNELGITINDLSKLGKALDGALKAGANEVVNINYQKANNSQVVNQSLAKACQNAMGKAQAIAGALGLQLGPVVNITEGNTYSDYPRPLAIKEMAMGGAGDIPIQPGQLSVQSSVTITFELK